MPRYVTVAELKDYLRNEKATEDDAFYEDAIETAEMAIDNDCNRKFVLATSSTARVVAPHRRSPVLRVYDCTAVASITENGSTVSASDYQLEPLNGLSGAGETVPYEQVRRKLSLPWYWNHDEATITVTATWGWAAIPSMIVEACKIGAKAVIDGRDVRLGLVGLADGGAMSPRDSRIVKQAVSTYRRVEAFGIA